MEDFNKKENSNDLTLKRLSLIDRLKKNGQKIFSLDSANNQKKAAPLSGKAFDVVISGAGPGGGLVLRGRCHPRGGGGPHHRLGDPAAGEPAVEADADIASAG